MTTVTLNDGGRTLRELMRANGYDPVPMIGDKLPIGGRRPEVVNAFTAIWAAIDAAKCRPDEIVDLALGTINYTLANVKPTDRALALSTLQDWLDYHKTNRPENFRKTS